MCEDIEKLITITTELEIISEYVKILITITTEVVIISEYVKILSTGEKRIAKNKR